MHLSAGLSDVIRRKNNSTLANRKLDGNTYRFQHNSQHNSFDLWDPPFFIRPNLQLDPHVSYRRYPDGRIDYLVNVTNRQPTGIWRWFRKGNGTAFNCQPVLILTDSQRREYPYPLIWLIVYGNYSQNPSHIDIDPDVTRPIIVAVVRPNHENPNNRSIVIPMIPSPNLQEWSGPLLPHGEYEVSIRITRRGPSLTQSYGRIRFPDDALQAV